MELIQLNKDQYVELVAKQTRHPQIRNKIREAIQFVKENELNGADLIVDGFTMGIYPAEFIDREEEFVNDLKIEFNNYQRIKSIPPRLTVGQE
jgi:hypothetical protein